MEDISEFKSFELNFIDVIGALQSMISSEAHLREAVRTEAARAEAAETACTEAKRVADDNRANAAATAAGATQASHALAAAQDELTTIKSKIELSERQKSLLEEKCSEMSDRIGVLEKELEELRPLQSVHSALQKQYVELESRVRIATEEARNEASSLESEVRRVERCARGGEEVRTRARLAAAAHARERKLAADEKQHLTAELMRANTEIARLGSIVSELQYRLSDYSNNKSKMKLINESESDTLAELRAALEVERAGAAKTEQALAAALADNLTLATQLHKQDNIEHTQASPSKQNNTTTNISPIDLFLAE
ncbi:myosin-11 [Papilio machaon]|uniref:myosin-11 n=1 Tax=Papilio machaon TaxID=76193 RepID=UPI001E662F52|nr:myosin-11 [Papilio machaon]